MRTNCGPRFQPTLEGRWALVTGANGPIGKCVALALAERGANVALVFRSRREEAERTRSQIFSLGREAMLLAADVTSPAEARRIVEVLSKEAGRVDVLVNGVGDLLVKPAVETTPEEWRSVLASNLDSAFFMAQAVLPLMRQTGWGRIVNFGVAGCSDFRAFRQIPVYGMAKSALLALTRALAREVAGWGITVNLISPGFLEVGEFLIDPQRIPARRYGALQEVVAALLYLVSDEAAYVNGTEIIVSGGWNI
ncbi:MAG: SDR family oxidoreductase [candidate division KSB1 bacterium]|nr:SDR family oxidoreductase [candidate division KSB1 bacterium]